MEGTDFTESSVEIMTGVFLQTLLIFCPLPFNESGQMDTMFHLKSRLISSDFVSFDSRDPGGLFTQSVTAC